MSWLRKPFVQGLVAALIITIIAVALKVLEERGDSGSSSSTATGSNKRASPGTAGEKPPEGVKGNEAPAPTNTLSDPFPPDVTLFSWEREEPTSLYPLGCPLTPGQRCVVRFLGTYRLKTLDNAILRFGAYENGSSEPVAHFDEKVRLGSEKMIYDLRFVVSESATKVQFKVTLHRSDGTLLYEPDPGPPVLEVRPAE